MKNFESEESNFYGLPKVHKSAQIILKYKESHVQSITIESITDFSLRPIIAGLACITHRLSNLLDILLRSYTYRVKSYLRDTMDFLNHLPETVPEHLHLASFDVQSMYSNIPHNLGHGAINFWLQKHPADLNSRFSKDFVLDGIAITLNYNTFNFNRKY